jgi:hypothetical protein
MAKIGPKTTPDIQVGLLLLLFAKDARLVGVGVGEDGRFVGVGVGAGIILAVAMSVCRWKNSTHAQLVTYSLVAQFDPTNSL